MRYFSEDDQYINAECDSCKRILKIKKNYCVEDSNGYKINPPNKCVCGVILDIIQGKSGDTFTNGVPLGRPQQSNLLKCPNCFSSQVTAQKQGFGLGKALVGNILAGPAGLWAGFIGSRKIYITCLKCGHRWEPRA